MVCGYMLSIRCCNARGPVVQLIRTSDWRSEDPGSNPGRSSLSFFSPWHLSGTGIYQALAFIRHWHLSGTAYYSYP